MVNFTTIACRISSRLKWYKNYKNRLRLTKVIVKNKMSRFLWFTVYICRHIRRLNIATRTLYTVRSVIPFQRLNGIVFGPHTGSDSAGMYRYFQLNFQTVFPICLHLLYGFPTARCMLCFKASHNSTTAHAQWMAIKCISEVRPYK